MRLRCILMVAEPPGTGQAAPAPQARIRSAEALSCMRLAGARPRTLPGAGTSAAEGGGGPARRRREAEGGRGGPRRAAGAARAFRLTRPPAPPGPVAAARSGLRAAVAGIPGRGRGLAWGADGTPPCRGSAGNRGSLPHINTTYNLSIMV